MQINFRSLFRSKQSKQEAEAAARQAELNRQAERDRKTVEAARDWVVDLDKLARALARRGEIDARVELANGRDATLRLRHPEDEDDRILAECSPGVHIKGAGNVVRFGDLRLHLRVTGETEKIHRSVFKVRRRTGAALDDQTELIEDIRALVTVRYRGERRAAFGARG